MLFLSGPRQVGKTTLVKAAMPIEPRLYFNWDSAQVRSAYRKDPAFFFKGEHHPEDWICFDEIHKRPHWKDILKGIYDQYRDDCRFIITGSALLETFKKSGDSLVGRYFNTHLFPINIGDFRKADFKLYASANDLVQEALEAPGNPVINSLLEFGGFPEPFYKGTAEFWKRWSNQHRELIISQDLRDLTRIQDLDKIEALLEMLVPGIGSPVSNAALGQDLEAAHSTVKNWLLQLEKVQLIFPVPPYSKKLRNVFKKEKKWFFTDWRFAGDNRFENYIASLLNRAVVLWRDRFGENFDLNFVRTHEAKEVDFLITLDGKPYLLIEAKKGKPDILPAYYQFAQKLKVPCLVVTQLEGYARPVKNPDLVPMFQLSASKLGHVLP